MSSLCKMKASKYIYIVVIFINSFLVSSSWVTSILSFNISIIFLEISIESLSFILESELI